VLHLFVDLREKLRLSMLFISHDLPVVRHISDRVVVMYLGRVMEEGPTRELFDAPAHPYTRALLSATPRLDAAHRSPRIVLAGDPPSPTRPPPGCVFHTRCPHAVEEPRRRSSLAQDGGSAEDRVPQGRGTGLRRCLLNIASEGRICRWLPTRNPRSTWAR
jgi:oligopeptide/dipeptide ABC transporter ATP-binding protein